jgi:TolB-like protein
VAAPSRQGYAGDADIGPAEMSDSVRDQLEKILRSAALSRSRRLSSFLRFAVEQTLAGHQAALKEYLVGVEVFGKTESFDPRIDSIVRVEARRLRLKLDLYYRTDGAEDPIVIQFPKGGYVPVIQHRDQMPASFHPARKSIAVRPFVSLEADSGDNGFCSGLTEDLISALTRLAGFRVVTHLGPPQPAFRLEGSVRRHGSRLRVCAQLIDTQKGEYLWSETYDREAADVFDVQEDLSRAIVAGLTSRNVASG